MIETACLLKLSHLPIDAIFTFFKARDENN